jgi:hypothetical protein
MVYGAVAYVVSLAMIFVGAAISQTHAAGAAVFWVVPGLLFVALAPFIAMARRWAAVATFALAALIAAAYIYNAPGDWWLALPVPAMFGILTAVAIAMGAGVQRDSAASGAGMVAEVYAACALLGGLVAVLLLPLPVADEGGAGLRLDAAAFGIAFAGLSVFVRRGRRWAMLGLALLALPFAVLMTGHELELRRWIAAAYPVAFGILALLALVAPARRASGGGRAGEIAAEVYAGLVYGFGVVVAFLAPAVDVGRAGFAGPRGMALYLLAAAAAFGALSVFIWRGRLSAMVAAFVLAALIWLGLASLHASFWSDAAWWAAPVLFGAMTAVCVVSARRAYTAIPPS